MLLKLFLRFALVAISVSSAASCADSEDADAALAAKVLELESYESISGTWEGEFYVVSSPDELLDKLQDERGEKKVFRIRIILKDEVDPEVFTLFPESSDWTKVDGKAGYAPATLGWLILLERSGGQWIERVSVTFDRLGERKAAITYTRTVHNWYTTEDAADAPEFYHMFGVGTAEKVGNVSADDSQNTE